MFGIDGPELIVIAVVVLLFAGPKHLPEVMRRAGRLAAELRNASRELRAQIETETRDLETPSEIGAKVRREIAQDLYNPYEEVIAADRALREHTSELVQEVASDPTLKRAGEDTGEKP